MSGFNSPEPTRRSTGDPQQVTSDILEDTSTEENHDTSTTIEQELSPDNALLTSTNAKELHDKANIDEAIVFVHEGVEMTEEIPRAAEDDWRTAADENDNLDIAEKTMIAVDYNIPPDEVKPDHFSIGVDAPSSANANFSETRNLATTSDNSIQDMFQKVSLDRTTSEGTNTEIDKVLTKHTGVASILPNRDNTAATEKAESPNAVSWLRYTWGNGITEWVKSNAILDAENVCYECQVDLIQRTTPRNATDWDYPEVEHKIPCTTAFMIFPSMDNLRWYYPYFSPTDGETHRANDDYRRTHGNGNDKSILAWWMEFAPASVKRSGSSKTNAESGVHPFPVGAIASSPITADRFEYLRRLYISINRDHNTNLQSREFENVKALFRRFITAKYGTGGVFNEKVFDYAWNVICLWLIELAGSHKTCNQRKNQYNLMTVGGRNKALARSYDGGAFKTGKKNVEDALDTNLRNSNISKHLNNIMRHYEKCCLLYATVSATATLGGLSDPAKISLCKRMHIWDNFRRITRNVEVIRDAYWAHKEKIDAENYTHMTPDQIKMKTAIDNVQQKIDNLIKDRAVLYNEYRAIQNTGTNRLATIATNKRDELTLRMGRVNDRIVELEQDRDNICDGASKARDNSVGKRERAATEVDEIELGQATSSNLSGKQQKTRHGGGKYEDVLLQKLKDADNELTHATRICNEACRNAGRSCMSVSDRPAAGLRSPANDRTGNEMKKLIEGRGGTRRKRRQPKSKRTRRVRKGSRSKRTRRARKTKRKSKRTRRRRR
jgi:hypothetical protein